MTRIYTACAALALALSVAGTAAAQGMPETPQQAKDREFQFVFQEGLYALTNRDMARTYQLFKRAAQLYPERPTAYYNLACAYSIDEKPAESVKYLRMAYEKGFNDLAHMGRDMDLDAIRKTPAYRQVRKEFETAALADVPEALLYMPRTLTAKGSLPLYVVIHNERSVPQQVLDRVVETTRSVTHGAVLVPQAPFAGEGGTASWRSQKDPGGGRLEFLVMKRVQELLEAHDGIDRQRIYLIGLGFSGYKAVSIAGHNPDVFAGVYAHGPMLGAEAGELSTKTRAYLVVDPKDPEQVASGSEARNAVFEAGGESVLERWSGTPQEGLATDGTPFVRGLQWLHGKSVKLPQAGDSVPF